MKVTQAKIPDFISNLFDHPSFRNSRAPNLPAFRSRCNTCLPWWRLANGRQLDESSAWGHVYGNILHCLEAHDGWEININKLFCETHIEHIIIMKYQAAIVFMQPTKHLFICKKKIRKNLSVIRLKGQFLLCPNKLCYFLRLRWNFFSGLIRPPEQRNDQ